MSIIGNIHFMWGGWGELGWGVGVGAGGKKGGINELLLLFMNLKMGFLKNLPEMRGVLVIYS